MNIKNILKESAHLILSINKKKSFTLKDQFFAANLEWLINKYRGNGDAGPLVSPDYVYDACAITKQSVQEWRKAGFPASTNGRIKTTDILKWIRQQWVKAREAKPESDVQKEYKIKQIEKLRIENAIKSKEFIAKDRAKDRVLMTLKAVRNILQYGKKKIAPMVVGCQSARDAEKIIDMQWAGAVKVLKDKSLVRNWDDE